MVFLSLTPNYTTACETDDLARHTTAFCNKKYKLLHEFDGHFLTFLCESLTTTIPPLNQKKERGGCQIPARQRPKRNFTLNSSSVRSCCFSKLMLMLLVISTPIPNAGYCYNVWEQQTFESNFKNMCMGVLFRGGRFQGLGMAFLLDQNIKIR